VSVVDAFVTGVCDEVVPFAFHVPERTRGSIPLSELFLGRVRI
jgi:hypothetical protein